jgi:hypothetical protein
MSEKQLQAAARQHALTASYLQGRAIAAKATRFANRLGWGRPTNIREQGGSVVLTYRFGYIVGNVTSNTLTIHPAANA